MSEEPGGESEQGEQSESERPHQRSTTPGPVKEVRGGAGGGYLQSTQCRAAEAPCTFRS